MKNLFVVIIAVITFFIATHSAQAVNYGGEYTGEDAQYASSAPASAEMYMQKILHRLDKSDERINRIEKKLSSQASAEKKMRRHNNKRVTELERRVTKHDSQIGETRNEAILTFVVLIVAMIVGFGIVISRLPRRQRE